MSTTAEVRLWGRTIGAVALEDGRAQTIIEEVRRVVAGWRECADAAGVLPFWRDRIYRTRRLGAF